MGATCSQDLREHVIAVVDGGFELTRRSGGGARAARRSRVHPGATRARSWPPATRRSASGCGKARLRRPARAPEDSYFHRSPAPWRHDRTMPVHGPINGELFLAWVVQFLGRTLRHGEIMVMHNLPGHKVAGVREAIEAVGGALRYPPPYSHDLNPIEQYFAKLKALLPKAGARTIDALEEAVADAIKCFKPIECANLLAGAGYRH